MRLPWRERVRKSGNCRRKRNDFDQGLWARVIPPAHGIGTAQIASFAGKFRLGAFKIRQQMLCAQKGKSDVGLCPIEKHRTIRRSHDVSVTDVTMEEGFGYS